MGELEELRNRVDKAVDRLSGANEVQRRQSQNLMLVHRLCRNDHNGSQFLVSYQLLAAERYESSVGVCALASKDYLILISNQKFFLQSEICYISE